MSVGTHSRAAKLLL